MAAENNGIKNWRADIPAKEDLLGLDQYIQGLADFIRTCATPMTISIQGGWGTGKTSLFQFVEDKLKKDDSESIKVVKVNTWQYSVAGLQAEIMPALLNDIVDAFQSATPSVKNSFAKLREPAIQLARLAIRRVSGIDVMEYSQKEKDIYEIIRDIKGQLELSINDWRREEKARLVIFIDDLDRLEPKVAVELMEGIKNFMDCQGCVFVLAIDEEVVFEGIKEKYGSELGEKRKQLFFDKLIQVPFTIPVTAYRLKEYIRSLSEYKSDSEVESYRIIIEALVEDKNPRALKRYFNLAKLYELTTDSTLDFEMLLAATIISLTDEECFDLLVRESDYTEGFLSTLSDRKEGFEFYLSQQPPKLTEDFRKAVQVIKYINYID